MGPKHSRDDLLDVALAVAAREGLHRLSFGRVAARAGVSDRIVVYYFPSKDDLVTSVPGSFGANVERMRTGISRATAGRMVRG